MADKQGEIGSTLFKKILFLEDAILISNTFAFEKKC